MFGALLSRIDAKASGQGWDARCPMSGRHKNGDKNPSVRLWVGVRGELVARCLGCGAGWNDLVKAYGTQPQDWWPNANPLGARRWTVGKITGRYAYFDENGVFLAQKIRREPGPNGESKHFSWRRPLPPEVRAARRLPDNAAAWGLDAGWYEPKSPTDWRHTKAPTGQAIQLQKCVPGLYKLPQLLGAPFDKPVLYVEGERKADFLTQLGFLAVSGPGGAGKWNVEWAEYFRDRRVVIFPDNNAPGIAHASAVAGSLVLRGAAGLKVITPGPLWPVPENEDIGDWLLKRSVLVRRQAVIDLLKVFSSYLAGPCEPARR